MQFYLGPDCKKPMFIGLPCASQNRFHRLYMKLLPDIISASASALDTVILLLFYLLSRELILANCGSLAGSVSVRAFSPYVQKFRE